jgi:hypothetical protein
MRYYVDRRDKAMLAKRFIERFHRETARSAQLTDEESPVP